MLGSMVLDVAIGLVFVFLLVSLLASAMREALETFLKTRASHLEAGLREVLRDPDGTGLVKQFYNHPLIYSLYSGDYVPNAGLKVGSLIITRGRNLPSYIPSSSFALALMDMAARGPQATLAPAAPVTLDSIRANVGSIENPAVQRAMLVAIDHAGSDLQQLQVNPEAWYNSAMDRVSGWYKRSSQLILLLLGLVMAIALNINSMHMGSMLYHDRTERDLMVASAQKATSSGPMDYKAAATDIGDLDALIGWHLGVGTELAQNGASDAVGWFLTAFAVSFGAPFWFDLLNRLIVIRSTVKPHQKSPEEGSADRSADGVIPATPAPLQAAPQASPAGTAQAALPQPAVLEPDGCDVDMAGALTQDEQLPAATGGVR